MENFTGIIDFQKLNTVDPYSAGGCTISHAHGAGKTGLIIVFVQTQLDLFPKCRPTITALANLLFTWEDEYMKLNIGIPFHNLKNLELSRKRTF